MPSCTSYRVPRFKDVPENMKSNIVGPEGCAIFRGWRSTYCMHCSSDPENAQLIDAVGRKNHIDSPWLPSGIVPEG